ncbi:MAG TPA: SDR family NAD(P)-dependent oxidoreductase [Kofleriaceae bacterium]|nr:SDR family NAD(P)-dependent oxidoreductase [Kofleriaceae bacterium]
MLVRDAKKLHKRERKHDTRRHDREQLLGSERAATYFQRPPATARVRMLRQDRTCYVCKQPFRRLHAFYHALCASCADRNSSARTDAVDLTGRRALVTGGRIKIGFEIVKMLASAGAHVTLTTRFPRDARVRLEAAGLANVDVVGLDFLDIRGVLRWIDKLVAGGAPLDILINNAAQTVRRPLAYYASLAAAEQGLLPAPTDALMFPDRVDEEGKPLDLRPINSWVLGASDVEPVELAEVHVVNAMVPFLLASRLRPLLAASPFADRYIVNVSAMEGVFDYANKQPRHPHTNMAKAALNMFTRTSAADYVRDGIYMNSVDTGWITQENPHGKKQQIEATGFVPPLDIVDGAARVIAPILRGVRGDRIAGAFFKDYEPRAW